MKIVFRCDPAIAHLLPKPIPAREGLPDWLKSMPRTAFSDFHGQDIRTVKQCPPFIDAMSTGFLIPLPCDVMVEEGRFSWDWPLPPLSLADHPRSPLSFHVPAQLEGSPLFQAGRPAIKFNSFWTIELEEGWSLLAMHPANRLDLPFRLLTGVVDSDRFSDIGIFFPALWTDPGFSGVLAKGTPVAHCVPFRREELALEFAELAGDTAERFASVTREILETPGVYRRRYRSKGPR
jgi:hypothetical protein